MNENSLKSYLTFHLGGEMFTVNVASVLEIIEPGEEYVITPLPKAPGSIAGVVNFRGHVLPILNLRVKMDMDNYKDNERFVIIILSLELDGQSELVGMIADKVVDVIEIEEADKRPVPLIGQGYDSEFIEGVVLKDKHFIMMLNTEAVLSIEDVIKLKMDAEQYAVMEETD